MCNMLTFTFPCIEDKIVDHLRCTIIGQTRIKKTQTQRRRNHDVRANDD